MSYEYFEGERRRSNPLRGAWTFLVLGFALALLGWFWRFPQLTYARGVVIESQPLVPPATRIVYEYSAFGARYRGERVMRISGFRPFYSVGSFFPVYFVTARPSESYGPNRPILQPLIWVGLGLAAACGTTIFFAWPR